MAPELTRRDFLARSGWVAAGTTVLVSCGSWLPVLPTFSDPELDESCLWLQILPGGRVRFLCPKSEMGQGILTGFTQIVAEELGVSADAVEAVIPDTSQIAPAKMTVGSLSVFEFFDPLSAAAAALRETLRERAAAGAGVDRSRVTDGRGGFVLPDGREIGYGELVSADAEVLRADPSRANGQRARGAGPGGYREIGKRWRGPDAREIVTGRTVFSRDVVVPGMLHGAVARAPRFGAKLEGADPAAARAVSGVVEAVVDPSRNLAGVVTEDPFALRPALKALAPRWSGGAPLGEGDLDRELDVERALAEDDFEHTLVSDGDLSEGAKATAKRLRARYESPFLAHAAMEPRAAVARIEGERVEIWTASQDPWFMRGRVARITGRSEDRVVVHAHRLGGGFGGRLLCQATEEAAWLATAVDRPVRVQWTREDEFRHNYFQPRFAHAIDAGLTADGRISYWQHDFVASPILFTSALIPAHLHWVVDIPGDPGTARNATPPYSIANRRVRYSDVRIPVPTGAWRGLGAAPNCFAVESAVDELAHLAGADPLEFRLHHIAPDERKLTNVLRRAAELGRWGEPTPEGVGRGIACCIYKDGTYVAIVAEVEARTGADIRVRRVACAHDCGLIINPDRVEAQIEGNVAWGCSMALRERTTVRDGQMTADNFHTYPVLRNSEMPDVEIALIQEPGDRPTGAGEPAIAPTPPAIANAVFAATGKRLRSLPLSL